MTTTRPGLYPLHDLLGTNVVLPEDSLYLQSGYPVGLAVPSADHNGKLGRSGQWHLYADTNGVRNADWLESTGTQLLTTKGLAYNTGENVLTTGATVFSRGVILIEGTRIETDTAFLNPVGGRQADPLIYVTATVPGRIWVYANVDGTSRIDSVGPAVADSPGVGEVTLVGLQVDALGVVTDGNVAPTIPMPPRLLVADIDVDLNANSISSVDDIGCETLTANVSIDTGTLTASSGVATIATTTSSATAGALAAINTSSGPGLTATSVTGIGGAFIGGGSGAGVNCIGGATGIGITALGGATSGAGVRGTSQGGASPGVSGVGANAVSCHGVLGTAVDTSSYGVAGTTAANATTSAAGVRADALKDGVALSAVAVSGNAIRAETDTTSPARSPVVIVPVDDDPSTAQAGAIFPNSTRNKFRINMGAVYESVHSSEKGSVFAVSAVSTNFNATSSGDIGDTTITPEQVGTVVVTVTGFWKGSTDTTTLTVLLKDITGGVTILTTQVLVAPDRDGDLQDRTVPFTVRYPYTLPSISSRLFRYRLNVSATTNWYDVFMTVQGVY